jgi:hypothetical protein
VKELTNRFKRNNLKRPVIGPHEYSQLVFGKGAKAIKKENNFLLL